MSVERPKGLMLNDITIKSNEVPAPGTISDVQEKLAKPRKDLLAGLISDDAQTGNTDNTEMIPIHLLDPFFDHKYKPYSEEKMQELTESVKILGIEVPLSVRKKADGRYEILAGHNRLEAAKRAGLRTVPGRIRDVNDAIARLIVNATNLQREQLSYSEKAWAYKTDIDALRCLGWRKDLIEAVEGENEKIEIDLTSVTGTESDFGHQVPKVENDQYARDIVAERYSTSARNISMYIRLLSLFDGLLDKVDSERVPFKAGVQFSHLSKEMQERINMLLDASKDLKVTVPAAETLHRLVKKGLTNEDLSDEDLLDVLSGKQIAAKKKPKAAKTPFNLAFKAAEKQFKKIDRYTIESIDEKELEKIVIDAVEEYLIRKRQ